MSIKLGILASSRQIPANLLLDIYPNSLAAYSLRKLRSLYTGSAIRVVRSFDNAQTDIGFDGSGNLDTISLLTFAVGTNVFIDIWYDQSGNGNNAISPGVFNRPIIVQNGILYTINGKASAYWDSSINQNMNLQTTAFSAINQPISVFSVTKLLNNQSIDASVIFDSNSVNAFVLVHNGTTQSPNNTLNMFAGTQADIELSNTNVNLISTYYNTTNSTAYINNVLKINNSNVGSNSLSGITIGNVRVSAFWNIYDFTGHITELVFYPTNQLSNNTGINTNINSYYTIY